MNDSVKSIVFTGGGTGGHVFPGIAVAEKLEKILRERVSPKAGSGEAGAGRHRIVWVGSSKGMEREIVERFSIPFYGIPAGKLRRYFSLSNVVDIGAVAAGYIASLGLLKRLNAALVFSKGGFVTVPPVAAAATLGIPAITHESDLDPGLATRLNARFCRRVLCAYEETAADFRMAAKAAVTGNPVRAELFAGDAERGRELLGVPEGKKVLLVLGGSQGARQINRMIGRVLDSLLEKAVVVHQTGMLDYGDYASHGHREGYIVASVFTEDFSHILAAADLVVSRAGAGTLWENGVFGKAALLVPLGGESSRGDQVRNAAYFARSAAAEVLAGEEVHAESLLEKSLDLLEDDERRKTMGARAARLCNADGAERIAREIADLLVP